MVELSGTGEVESQIPCGNAKEKWNGKKSGVTDKVEWQAGRKGVMRR
jgi:hypothetical protein